MTTTPAFDDADFPFAVNCRFSKTIMGLPKKCGYCQKIIVGTGFTCQNCSFRCHKRCVMIEQGNQVCLRLKRCPLTPSGEDSLISKFLKSDINSNGVDSSGYNRKTDKRSNSEGAAADSNGNTPDTQPACSRFRRHSRALVQRESFMGFSSCSPNDDPFYPSSTATSPSLLSQPSSPRRHRNTVLSNSALTPSSTTDRRLSTTLVNTPTSSTEEKRPQSSSGSSNRLLDRVLKFFSWTPTSGKNDDPNAMVKSECCDQTENGSVRHDASRRTSVNKIRPLLHMKSEPSCHQTLARLCPRSQQGSPAGGAMRQRVKSTVTEKLFPPKEQRRKSANEAIQMSLAEGSQKLDAILLRRPIMRNGENEKCGNIENKNLMVSHSKPVAVSPLLHRIRQRTAAAQGGVTGTGHKCLRNHESDPIKIVERRSAALLRGYEGGYLAKRKKIAGVALSKGDEEIDPRERLANTWPLAGYHHYDYDECDATNYAEVECGGFTDNGEKVSLCGQDSTSDGLRTPQTRLSELGEWTILYTDLIFGECVQECRNMSTYKGRWHGDVMIHTYDISGTEKEILMRAFLEEVRTLTKIRHENVALFMGASVEAPLVAVVTSIRKGCNLYETVHLQLENRRLTQTAKLNIARQVAQGMGYLHAKGIILRTLTSKSIYLECKVKISMVDDGAPLKRHDRVDMGCIRRGHLTYYCPELMQTIRVSPPALIVDGVYTKEADVYAFGTILYEMFAGDFPLSQSSPHSVIWLIGNGKWQNMDNLQCGNAMKGLIECCWSDDPVYRPSFTEILKELQHTAALHIKHSSSVPEKLNKAGVRSPHQY